MGIGLTSNDSISDLKADLEEYCQEFGSVVSIEIPKHKEPGEGSVLVEFSQLSAAIAASKNLQNRKFDDQNIMCLIKDRDRRTHALNHARMHAHLHAHTHL